MHSKNTQNKFGTKKTRKINFERKKTRNLDENLKSAIYGDAKYSCSDCETKTTQCVETGVHKLHLGTIKKDYSRLFHAHGEIGTISAPSSS